MIRSENELAIPIPDRHPIRTLGSLGENFLPQFFTRKSHLENPNVLMGWQSGIGMASHFQNESYTY